MSTINQVVRHTYLVKAVWIRQTPSNKNDQDLRWSHEVSASKNESRIVDFIVPMVVDNMMAENESRHHLKRLSSHQITIEGRHTARGKPVIDKIMRKKGL
jgi:hypothetical protein